MHVTSWPEDDNPGLSSLLDRIRKLYPSSVTQTHLLHLASYGAILPHVDNVEASGSWILGVSLGTPRIMHMESLKDHFSSFDVLLPSGSVYLQKCVFSFSFSSSFFHFSLSLISFSLFQISLLLKKMHQ
jgi:alkylated DNA repair protein alkB homolog 7